MTYFTSPAARDAYMLGISEARYWDDVAMNEADGDFFATNLVIGTEDSMVEPEDRRYLDPTDFPVSVDVDWELWYDMEAFEGMGA